MAFQKLSTLEEFNTHYNYFTSRGYELLNSIERKDTIEEGQFMSIVEDGIFAVDNLTEDKKTIYYGLKCFVKEKYIFVIVTRETIFQAFNALKLCKNNARSYLKLLSIRVGSNNCTYINPFYDEFYQPRYTFPFSSSLSKFAKPLIRLPQNGHVIKFKNGRFLYIVENCNRLIDEYTFVLRSTTGEVFKQKIDVTDKKIEDVSPFFGDRVYIDNISSNSLQILNFIKINISKEDFNNLPENPKDYPYPYTPIRHNKIVDLPYEIWYDIPDFEELYSVSNYGRLKSKNYEGFLFNEGILTSDTIKLCKDFDKSYHSRSEILNFSVQDFSSYTSTSKIPQEVYDSVVGIIKHNPQQQDILYFSCFVRNNDITSATCFFTKYEEAVNALIVLASYFTEQEIDYQFS